MGVIHSAQAKCFTFKTSKRKNCDFLTVVLPEYLNGPESRVTLEKVPFDDGHLSAASSPLHHHHNYHLQHALCFLLN